MRSSAPARRRCTSPIRWSATRPRRRAWRRGSCTTSTTTASSRARRIPSPRTASFSIACCATSAPAARWPSPATSRSTSTSALPTSSDAAAGTSSAPPATTSCSSRASARSGGRSRPSPRAARGRSRWSSACARCCARRSSRTATCSIAAGRPSVPIVLDIFPADRESGYFFDTTRTFCVGPIPQELAKVHAEVLEAFELAERAMVAGTAASSYQALVCDYFEARGYATTRSNPATLDGYVHSLGHGVGLDIHEKPFFGLSPAHQDAIEIGDIVTIEPGLYFPDREIGVGIEDTFVVGADGRVQSLCRGDRGLLP